MISKQNWTTIEFHLFIRHKMLTKEMDKLNEGIRAKDRMNKIEHN